jgi:hypothetical protein
MGKSKRLKLQRRHNAKSRGALASRKRPGASKSESRNLESVRAPSTRKFDDDALPPVIRIPLASLVADLRLRQLMLESPSPFAAHMHAWASGWAFWFDACSDTAHSMRSVALLWNEAIWCAPRVFRELGSSTLAALLPSLQS